MIYSNSILERSKKKIIDHFKSIISIDKLIITIVINFKYKYLMFSRKKFIEIINKKYGINNLTNSSKKVTEVILKLIYKRVERKFV